MAQHNHIRLDQGINQHICVYHNVWHSTTLVKSRNTSRVVGSKMGTKTNVKCTKTSHIKQLSIKISLLIGIQSI